MDRRSVRLRDPERLRQIALRGRPAADAHEVM
jgi:hypothetical protein